MADEPDPANNLPAGYVPAQVWTWDKAMMVPLGDVIWNRFRVYDPQPATLLPFKVS